MADTGWEWLFGGTKTRDLTDDWLKSFNAANGYDSSNRDMNYARSNALYGQLTNGGSMDPSSWYGRSAGLVGGQSRAINNAEASANRSGQSIWNTFQNVLPSMQNYAQNAAGQATSLGTQSLQGLANLQAANAGARTSSMLSRTGVGGHSGAAAGAIAKAIAEPLLGAQANIGQLYGNAYMNALSPLAQAGYNAELNKTNEFLNLLSGINQTQSNYAATASPLMNALSDQSQQLFLAPQMQSEQVQGLLPTLGGALLTGLGGSLGGAAGGALLNGLGSLFSSGASGGMPSLGGGGFQSFLGNFLPGGNTAYLNQLLSQNPYQSPLDADFTR